MKLEQTELPTDTQELQKIIQQQNEEIQKSHELIKSLQISNEQKDNLLGYYKEQLYNKKSEKWTPEEEKQAYLFNEPEKAVDEEKQKEIITVKEHKKRKKKNRAKREKLDPELPRNEVILDLEEKDKVCGCGCMLTVLPTPEVTEKLKIIPAQYIVDKTVRLKYVCKKCEGSGDENRSGVKVRPVVPQLIPKAILHRDSLAYMIVQKYCDHIPLYRMNTILRRSGVSISRATIANNLMTVSEILEPIANEVLYTIQKASAMQIDETRLQVINEPDRNGTNLSWMWCFRSGLMGESLPVVYYHYDRSRSAKFLKEFLCGYKGMIQTDGLGTYNTHLPSIVGEQYHAGCNVHARRKFTDIYKSVKNNDTVNFVLDEYKKIYRLEKTYKQLKISVSKLKLEKRRQRYSLPIMERLKKYLMNECLSLEHGSPVYKAARYFLSEYEKLIKFIYNGDIPPDTNNVENAIRPFTVGRKNWLFCVSPRGAKASAIFYTLVENAKLCGLNPYEYLKLIFDEIVNNPKFKPPELTPQAIANRLKK